MPKPGMQRIKFTPSKYTEIMKGDGVRADLQARADRVAGVVRGQTEAYIIADTYVGTNRSGATVIGVPMREEEERRILGGAIDAAR